VVGVNRANLFAAARLHRVTLRRPPMTDRDLLLRAVSANPADNLPRLMLADWL
jgi:hypothetical protein